MTYLIRATTPYEAKDYVPAVRYWNAALSMWDDYSEATGYDTDAPQLPQTGPRPASKVEVVAAYPLDAQGWPYTDSEIGPGAQIGRYDTLAELEDGIGGLAEPGDTRDAAR